MKMLLTDLSIHADDVIAIGDSINDIELLAHAGIGVAMPHAAHEVLAAADDITTGFDEDGVAVALERHLL